MYVNIRLKDRKEKGAEIEFGKERTSNSVI